MPFLMNKKKSAQAVSTITGADGPTAFFILSKSNKITLKQWMQKMTQNVPRTDFDIKLRMFQKAMEGMNGNMHISIEENYGYIGGGASGSKAIKAFQKLFRDIYKYYGVTEEDIRTKSKRYEELLRTLAR